MDFDPAIVSFDDLLDVFWANHSPVGRQWSTQYAHIAFWENQAQHEAIEASAKRVAERLGQTVTTRVRELTAFYVAEDYHQKYYLRQDSTLMRDFAGMYPDAAEFRESTAAARVNGYIGGVDDARFLLETVPGLGLSDAARDRVIALAGGATGSGVGCRI